MIHTYQIKKPAGFTLVELVMVIVILSVLAAAGLPRFINLKVKATDNAETYSISSLATAIKTKYVQNIAAGIEPDSAWYSSSDLFSLITNPPPNTVASTWAQNSQDNVNWRVATGFSAKDYIIACPHFNGQVISNFVQNYSKGSYWVYSYAPLGEVALGSVALYFQSH